MTSLNLKQRYCLLDWININEIGWSSLSTNPNAIDFLEENIDKIDWTSLSNNPNAIHLLESNMDKIDWKWLSYNPNAIHILEANIDKINWRELSANPNAIHLLEANQDKIDWRILSANPSIFTYDYNHMRSVCNIYKEELIAYVFHPSRLFKNVTEETDLDELLDVWD